MEAITIREYLIKKMEAQIKKVEKQAIKAENHAKQAENQANLLKKEQETAVLNLHAKGFATEDIADIFSKPLSFVMEVLEKRFDNK